MTSVRHIPMRLGLFGTKLILILTLIAGAGIPDEIL